MGYRFRALRHWLRARTATSPGVSLTAMAVGWMSRAYLLESRWRLADRGARSHSCSWRCRCEVGCEVGPAGVLLRQDAGHQSCWFGSWLAQDPAATNFELIRLEGAISVADALALAPEIGIPHQNLVVGDREGHIAWTIAGRIPARTMRVARAIPRRGPARKIIRSYWTLRPAESGPPTRESPRIHVRLH